MELNQEQLDAIKKDGELLIMEAMIRAKFAKTSMCEDAPMTDAPPMLIISQKVSETDENGNYDELSETAFAEGYSTPYVSGMIPLIHQEDVADAMSDVLKALPQMEVKPSFMFLLAEGYVRVGTKVSIGSDYKRGDMEREYRENPFTDVREAITIMGVDAGRNFTFHRVAPYVYGDSGMPDFSLDVENNGSPSSSKLETGQTHGRLGDLLIAGITFLNQASEVMKFHNLFTVNERTDERFRKFGEDNK